MFWKKKNNIMSFEQWIKYKHYTLERTYKDNILYRFTDDEVLFIESIEDIIEKANELGFILDKTQYSPVGTQYKEFYGSRYETDDEYNERIKSYKEEYKKSLKESKKMLGIN